MTNSGEKQAIRQGGKIRNAEHHRCRLINAHKCEICIPTVDMLRESGGQYTRDTLTRIGIMSGQLGTRIVEMLGGGHKQHSVTKEAAQATQVAEFVRLYKDDELIRTVPGRKLKMQPKFEYQTEIKDCEAFMARVTQLSEDVDLSEAYYFEPASS